MIKVFIDSDVILDSLFERKPFSDDSSKILGLCEKGEIEGFVTSIILSNIFFLLRKISSHEKVIETIKELLKILSVSITSKEILMNALESNFKDFEDAIQNFSAQNEKGIKILITRNIKDYKYSSLSIMTPDNFLKSF